MNKPNFPLSLSSRTQIIGWAYLAFEMLLLPTVLTLLLNAMGCFSEPAVNFLYFVVNFLSCGWIFRDLLKKSAFRFRFHAGQVLLWTLIGLVAYYTISSRLNVVIYLLAPDFTNANDAAVAEMIFQSPFLLFLGTVILVPLAEECLFRGLIFTPLCRRSRLAAYIVSSLAFCCIHLLAHLGTLDAVGILISLIQYLPAGICLALAYDRSQSLFSPILIHSTINLVSYLLVRFLYA